MAVVLRGFRKHLQYTRNVFPSTVVRNYCKSEIGKAEEFLEYQYAKEHDRPNYDYEISQDPTEWAYVEKLMPIKVVPPVYRKPEYPSGWRPQTAKFGDHPYFVERTRNHMLPVYMVSGKDGKYFYTRIRNIRGDIWAFHDELHKHVEEKTGKIVHSLVLEANGQIRFFGDVVYYCEQWILSKGF